MIVLDGLLVCIVFAAVLWGVSFLISYWRAGRRELKLKVDREEISANHRDMARLLDLILAYEENIPLLPPRYHAEAEHLTKEYNERVA